MKDSVKIYLPVVPLYSFKIQKNQLEWTANYCKLPSSTSFLDIPIKSLITMRNREGFIKKVLLGWKERLLFRGVPNRNPPRKCTFRLLVFLGQKSYRLFPGRLRTQTAKGLFLCHFRRGNRCVFIYPAKCTDATLSSFSFYFEAAIVSTGRVQFLFSGNTDRLFPYTTTSFRG